MWERAQGRRLGHERGFGVPDPGGAHLGWILTSIDLSLLFPGRGVARRLCALRLPHPEHGLCSFHWPVTINVDFFYYSPKFFGIVPFKQF